MNVQNKIILLSLIIIISLTPLAFAQYYEAVLDLDPIPSQVFVGDTITFSGKLSTTDGHVIQEATVSIKDDVTFDIDTVLGTLTTDDDGKFTGDWEAKLRLDGGAYDFYAYYDGASDISYARSQTHSVTVFTASGSSYVPSSTSYNYEPTEITLNSIPKTVSIGQTITFSGKLTSNGLAIKDAKVCIKDEDPLDLDDYLVCVLTDSQGRYTAKWTVTDVESGDRKYSSAALGAYYMVPLSSVNDLLNAAEFNTIEIFAVFEQDESEFQESNTCIPRYTDDETYLPCSNNVIVISNPVDLESKILGMLLGGGVSDSDILYSILGSDDPSDLVLDEFEDVLLEAIQDELGINQDLSMEQMLELLDDPSLASQYQSQSSYSSPPLETIQPIPTPPKIPDFKPQSKKTFDIKPMLTNGFIEDYKIDPFVSSIILDVKTENFKSGEMQLVLPRGLIDSKFGSSDDVFFVLIDGEETGYDQVSSNSAERILRFSIPAGANNVEIIGTEVATNAQVIPEFQEITIMVLFAGIVGVISISKKLQIKTKTKQVLH